MLFVNEGTAGALVTHELAYDAIAAAFRDLSESVATINPVVIGAGCREGESYTVKSGAARRRRIVGLKVGSYWPCNAARELPPHSSSILLLDPETGRAHALIAAATLNGFRTAAADAVAVDALARPDAVTLAIIGAGHQARFEVAAIRRVRQISRVLIVSRRGDVAAQWAEQLSADGVAASVADARTACRAADIIVTATSARSPLFDADWIRPGTHISSMGSDQRGKQELPVELLEAASVFADLPSQSLVIGEFQHIAAAIGRGDKDLVAIGDVLRRERAGRRTRDEITVFDSSGVAIQDLYLAAEILALAVANGSAVEVT